MAERAAHITSSLQHKPSLFEVIAQDSLCELLQPSFNIFVEFLGRSNPQRYSWLNLWKEEAFFGINGCLQSYYLFTKDASFSESFYGLKRVSVNGNVDQLSNKAKLWSLFCLVGIPYLVHKINRGVTQLQTLRVGEVASLTENTVLASWRGLCLIQYLMYLTNRTEAHSPLLSVANLSLHYSPEEPTSIPYTWRQLLSNPRLCAEAAGNGVTNALQWGAFFLQALQWWHSDEKTHDKLTDYIPPPPVLEESLSNISAAICPVCRQNCKIETVLTISGYVFCFRCIREALLTTQKCPVTQLPASLDQLVRLYPSK